jgi:hypothetical protein
MADTITLDPSEVEIEGQDKGAAPVSLSPDDVEVVPPPMSRQQAGDTLNQYATRSNAQLQPEYASPAKSILQRFAAQRRMSEGEAASEATSGAGAYRMAPKNPTPQTIGQQVENFTTPQQITPVSMRMEQPAQRPQVQMESSPVTDIAMGDEDLARLHRMTPEQASQYEQLQQEHPSGFAAGPRMALHEIFQGAGDIASGLNPEGGMSPSEAIALGRPIPNGAGRNPSQMAKGATEMMSGAMTLGTPLFAEAVAAKPLQTIAGYLAGVLGGKGTAAAAKAVGATPEEQEFANTLGFFLPTAAATLAGVRTAEINSDKLRGKVVSAFGGRVQAGIGATPEEIGGGVRVGNQQVSVTVPRTPSATEVTAKQLTDNAISAMTKKQQTDAAAAAIVQGVPPAQAVAATQPPKPEPPKPPMPQGMEQGILHPETIQSLAQAISMAPPAERPNLVLEAHENLAKWMAQQGRVMVDGQIHIVKNPEQATQLAAKLVNTEVMRQDQLRNQSASQQQSAQPQAQAQPTPPQGEPQPENGPAQNPAEWLYQRAQTILDSTDKPTPTLLQRNLRIAPRQAQTLFDRWQQEKTAANLPTVGSREEPVVEESRATIDAQIDALRNGNVNVVMLPQGSSYRPQLPEGFRAMDVKKGPGAGTYIYSPDAIKPSTIRRAAENGTHGDLLGHVQTKQEIAQAPSTVVVQASKPDGTPIQDSEVDATNPQAIQAQAQVLQERHPEAQIQVKPTDQVIQEQLDAQKPRQEIASGPEILHRFTNDDEGMQSEVARIGQNRYSVILHDLDSGEVLPEAKIFNNEEAAIRQARAWANVPEMSGQAESAPEHGESPIAELSPDEVEENHAVQESGAGAVGAHAVGRESVGRPAESEGVGRRDEGQEAAGASQPVSLEPSEVEVVNPAEATIDPLESHLYQKIIAGEMPKDNIELRRMVGAFDGRMASNARMKEAQEALESALARRAREIVAEGKNERETFDRLVELYNSQPSLNVRTSTSVENQAYSTPAPLAFVADRLAGVNLDTSVYEPTAGNGMLLIAANPKRVTANELDPARAARLKAQGFHVTIGDALSPEVKPKSVDAVVANPPFGGLKEEEKPVKVSVDGYKIGQIDHLIAARALEAMKDDGKATLILGASRAKGGISTDDRIFLNWLYSHYNVTGHFEVDGKLYSRQGASWPVRVISINGRVASEKFSPEPGRIERASTWKDVYEQYRKSLAAQEQERPDQGNGNTLQRNEGETRPEPVQRLADVEASGTRRARPAAGEGHIVGESGGVSRPSPDRAISDTEGVASGNREVRRGVRETKPTELAEPGRNPQPARERSSSARGADRSNSLTPADNEYQASYTPASSKKDEGILIPTNMREPLQQAMRALEDEIGDIDEFVASELGYESVDDLHDVLMGLQVDSVAAAIHQIQKGKAVIIADQTGIGKGRQAASIIRWAERQGRIPVFVTAKPQLFTDMYNDLADIGSHDIVPFIVNVDEAVVLPDGKKAFTNHPVRHRAILKQIAETGELPAGKNAVFLTYSQVNQENTQRHVLRRLAHNAVFIMDESHNAGGDSSTGEFFRGLLQNASGVTYLSATYAKRPDNMPLYFKTDIGEALGDSNSLIEAMRSGGLPLQTVVSSNLVKSGQLFRRERSYTGVQIKTKVAEDRYEEHARLSDSVTEALRAISDADHLFHTSYVEKARKEAHKQGRAISGRGNKASSTVQHMEFSSVVHNFVRQMLLALKADDAADEAIASLRRGEKPLIAVDNTMGSFLGEFAANHDLKPGDELTGFDYRTVLHRALDRTRYVTVKLPTGDEVKKYVPLEDLDPDTRSEYTRAQEIIDGLDVGDLPVSPIDWIRHRIEQEGYSVAEITGRDLAVDYSTPDRPKLAHVSRQEQKQKVETTRRFNNGGLDVVILNRSGSTGISLHASERFKDQRQRHMIVAQPALDINEFMQMLGRIHRTGQVKLPKYTILNVALPAEKRPTAILAKKMKSLNANTSSNTESATSVEAVDMLNKYGDEIVGNYLHDNPEYEAALGLGGSDDIARRATGKLALLPVEMQEAFYKDVEAQYNDYIHYLNSTNQNELEPRTFDYDAREEKSRVLVEGENKNSPFGQDAIYNEFSIKMQAKPVTPEEVRQEINKHLDGLKPNEFMQEFQQGLDQKQEKYLRSLDPDSVSYSVARTAESVTKQFLRDHGIGSTLRIEINGETYNAAITNIRSLYKGNGSPYALSKINVTLATAGPMRFISVPASQLGRIEVSKLHEAPEDLFRVANPDARETAKIITGNLLSAYGNLKDTRGTIINFTKADGTTEQGILLPKKFEIGKHVNQDYRLRTPEQAARFLKTSQHESIGTLGIQSRDGEVRVIRARNGALTIVTPKAKATGGKYFLDPALRKVTGDFVSLGNTMRAEVPRGKETEALRVLMDKTALYAGPSMAEEARAMDGVARTLPVRHAWEGFSKDEFEQARSRSLTENIEQSRAEIVFSRRRAHVPMVRVNADAYHFLQKMLRGPQWLGCTYPHGRVLIKELRALSTNQEASSKFRDSLNSLCDVLESAIVNNCIIFLRPDATDETVAEEQFHLWEVSSGLLSLGALSSVSNDLAFPIISRYLVHGGYDPSSLEELVRETVAKIATGQLQRVGIITKTDGQRIIYKFFKTLAKERGVQFLRDIPDTTQDIDSIASLVRSEYRDDQGSSGENPHNVPKGQGGRKPSYQLPESGAGRSLPERTDSRKAGRGEAQGPEQESRSVAQNADNGRAEEESNGSSQAGETETAKRSQNRGNASARQLSRPGEEQPDRAGVFGDQERTRGEREEFGGVAQNADNRQNKRSTQTGSGASEKEAYPQRGSGEGRDSLFYPREEEGKFRNPRTAGEFGGVKKYAPSPLEASGIRTDTLHAALGDSEKDPAWREARVREGIDNIVRAAFTAQRGSENDAPYIALGPDAYHALVKFTELGKMGDWLGVSISKASAVKIIETIERYKNIFAQNGMPLHAHRLNAIIREMERQLADYGAVVLVRDNLKKEAEAVLLEERFHAWQHKYQTDSDEIFAELDNPLELRIAAQALNELGYPGDKNTVLAETSAKIAAGLLEDVGLTSKQAQDLLDDYLAACAKVVGPDAIRAIPTVHKSVQKIVEGVKNDQERKGNSGIGREPKEGHGGAASQGSIRRSSSKTGATEKTAGRAQEEPGATERLRESRGDSLLSPNRTESLRKPRAAHQESGGVTFRSSVAEEPQKFAPAKTENSGERGGYRSQVVRKSNADPEWIEAASRSPESNVLRAKTEIVPAQGNDASMLKLNADAYFALYKLTALGRTFGHWDGVALDDRDTRWVLAGLLVKYEDSAKAGQTLVSQRLESLINTLNAHRKQFNGIVLLRNNLGESEPIVALEERFHAWQLANGGDSDAVVNTLKGDPTLNIASKGLGSLGYRTAIPRVVVAESTAKIAAGLYKELGLTLQQAHELLATYLRAVRQHHGSEAINLLPSVHESVLKTIEELKHEKGQLRSTQGGAEGGHQTDQRGSSSDSGEGILRAFTNRSGGFSQYPEAQGPEQESGDVAQNGRNRYGQSETRATEKTAGRARLRESRGDSLLSPNRTESLRKPRAAHQESGGVTFRSSVFGADLAAKAAGKVFAHEFNKEVKPFFEKAQTSVRNGLRELQSYLAPRSTADPNALDNVMSALGRREKRAFLLERALSGYEKTLRKLNQKQLIDIIDRMKTGAEQPTPELQQLADFIRDTDEATYREVVEQQAMSMRPALRRVWENLTPEEKEEFFTQHEAGEPIADKKLHEISNAVLDYKENHFRVLWKEIPGKEGATRGKPNAGRGPLAGSKGFLKRSTLATMSEGIDAGGVPWSYNPVTLFKMSQADAYRYITALQIWRDALDDGARVFVKQGKPLPAGFRFVEDRIGDVKFPAASGEGMVEAGKWALREDYAQLLNHFLSPDWVRRTSFGRGLMWTKNQLTAWRLGFSPFHAFTTATSSIASRAGLGLAMLNRAAREMDAALAGRAFKTVASAPAAPVTEYRLGSDIFKYVENPQEFIKSSRGQDLLKKYPGLDKMMDAAFAGGAKLALHQDERLHSIKAFREAIAEKKALGALFHSLPALNQYLMTPLFEYYIPRVKLAAFIREFSERAADHTRDIGAGELTYPELARQTWDSVEDVFGQMNWDKFFWNNTFKSIVQLAFRAFTWFAGNARLSGRALSGQMREVFESLAYLNQRFNPNSDWGPRYSSTGAIPRLHPDMAKLLGLAATFVLGNVILQKVLTGENPDDWRDYLAARVGGTDNHGNPRRIVLPAIVLRDAISLWAHGAGAYMRSKLSDPVSGFLDVMENEDFRHAMVYDPDDPLWKEIWDGAKHFLGSPIGVENFIHGGESGEPTAQRVLTGLGFSNAPAELNLSRAERKMLQWERESLPRRTEEQVERSMEQRRTQTPSWMSRQYGEPELTRMFKRLSYMQAREIYEKYATPEERVLLKPLLDHKRMNAIRRHRIDYAEAAY